MKKLFFALLLLVCCAKGYSQEAAKTANVAFQAGEQITYKLKYGFFTAAEAKIRVENSPQKFEGQSPLHIVADAKTAGTFDVFFKVRNMYETYIDPKTLLPYYYAEDRHEASYKHTDKVTFNHETNKITAASGTYPLKGDVFDFLSAYYYARNLDVSHLKIGEKLELHYFLEDGVHAMTITFAGREKVKCALGTFNCLKFNPTIIPGRIFRKNSMLYLWVTDDANRIPIKAHVELVVGSLVMDLTEAKGLKYPLNPIKK